MLNRCKNYPAWVVALLLLASGFEASPLWSGTLWNAWNFYFSIDDEYMSQLMNRTEFDKEEFWSFYRMPGYRSRAFNQCEIAWWSPSNSITLCLRSWIRRAGALRFVAFLYIHSLKYEAGSLVRLIVLVEWVSVSRYTVNHYVEIRTRIDHVRLHINDNKWIHLKILRRVNKQEDRSAQCPGTTN